MHQLVNKKTLILTQHVQSNKLKVNQIFRRNTIIIVNIEKKKVVVTLLIHLHASLGK